MTVHWTLTLAGLQHTTVTLKDRHEARRLLRFAKRVTDPDDRWSFRFRIPSRRWDLYAASGYRGLLTCQVERQ